MATGCVYGRIAFCSFFWLQNKRLLPFPPNAGGMKTSKSDLKRQKAGLKRLYVFRFSLGIRHFRLVFYRFTGYCIGFTHT